MPEKWLTILEELTVHDAQVHKHHLKVNTVMLLC